jgi:hypothetical protein
MRVEYNGDDSWGNFRFKCKASVVYMNLYEVIAIDK